MIYYGLELKSLDTYFQLKDLSTSAATPQSGEVRLYAKVKSSVSNLYWKNDAGTEYDLGLITSISGGANRIAYFSSATDITSSATFVFDGTSMGLGTATPNYVGFTRTLTIESATNTAVEFASSRADSTGVLIGALAAWYKINSASHNRIAEIDFVTDGATANQRGGSIQLLIKANGSTTLSERVRLDNLGTLIIGGGGIQSDLSGNAIETHPPVGSAGGSAVYCLGFGTGNAGNFQGRSARGTSGSPSALGTDDLIASFTARGYGATGYAGGFRAAMQMFAAETWTDSAHGTYIKLWTTPTGGSIVPAERFRIGPAGQFGIGGATFGGSGDIFSSGGASAAPTWVTRATLNAAFDHNVLANLTTGDVHTQYALLAGRSGGQILKGGTAAADALNLVATAGVGAGSETINFKLGNNGGKQLVSIQWISASTSQPGIILDSATASTQFNMIFADNGTAKWYIYKTSANEFRIYDAAATQDVMFFKPISGLGAAAAAVRIAPTINTANATNIGFYVNCTFSGSGDGPWGASMGSLFTPSASINAAYNSLNIGTFGPPSSVTITAAIAAYYGTSYQNVSGAVTSGYGLWINAPTISGSLKPTNSVGLYVGNQGASGITNASGIWIDTQSTATNSYVFQFGNVDTTAAGAYYGRLPVLYNGLLKYIHVFSA